MQNLVVEVPLLYQVEIREPGQRNWREAFLREPIPVSVPMLSASEAPVALRISTQEMASIRGSGLPGYDPVDIRVIGGDLYAPLDFKGNSAITHRLEDRVPWDTKPLSDEALSDRLIGDRGVLDIRPPEFTYRSRTLRQEEISGLRNMIPLKREEALQSLSEKVGSIVVVDGIVLEKVPEPVWRIESDRFERRAKLAWSDEYECTQSPGTTFRIDRLADAIASLPPSRTRDAVVRGDAEVLVPEVLAFDPLPSIVLGSVRSAVRGWDVEEFRSALPEELLAWAALRDAAAPFVPDLLDRHAAEGDRRNPLPASRDEVAAVVEAVRTFLPSQIALSRRYYEGIQMGFDERTHHKLLPLLSALRRWDRETGVRPGAALDEEGPDESFGR